MQAVNAPRHGVLRDRFSESKELIENWLRFTSAVACAMIHKATDLSAEQRKAEDIASVGRAIVNHRENPERALSGNGCVSCNVRFD